MRWRVQITYSEGVGGGEFFTIVEDSGAVGAAQRAEDSLKRERKLPVTVRRLLVEPVRG